MEKEPQLPIISTMMHNLRHLQVQFITRHSHFVWAQDLIGQTPGIRAISLAFQKNDDPHSVVPTEAEGPASTWDFVSKAADLVTFRLAGYEFKEPAEVIALLTVLNKKTFNNLAFLHCNPDEASSVLVHGLWKSTHLQKTVRSLHLGAGYKTLGKLERLDKERGLPMWQKVRQLVLEIDDIPDSLPKSRALGFLRVFPMTTTLSIALQEKRQDGKRIERDFPPLYLHAVALFAWRITGLSIQIPFGNRDWVSVLLLDLIDVRGIRG